MNLLLAATPLDIAPETLKDINSVGLFFMMLVFLSLIGLLTWKFLPVIISSRRKKRAEKIKATTRIWFDSNESVLHCGNNKVRIEPNSLEYFVCSLSF